MATYGFEMQTGVTGSDMKSHERGTATTDGGTEKKSPESATTSWSEFTQNSTFHGIKYIFQSNSSLPRRLLWAVCVLVAVGLFTYQVCSRSLTFFKYETNVDVTTVHADWVPFPAVTICNQNNFRLTSTVAFGLYDFVDAVYGGHNFSELDASRYSVDLLDTETVIQETAHQKEDLIQQCTWNDRPCNIADDFQTIMTDLGVCYTFNSGWNSTGLRVEESGPEFGLSLILNLEQYEYMRGPQSDAGVKILLHDQDDTPQMKGRGFAVAPGAHTLVGIRRNTLRELEPPYGECSELASPMAVCVTECKTRQVVAQCGCRHPYMANLNDEVCNMTSTFVCVQKASETMHVGSANCDCAVPCKQVSYEPSLSYADLSQYNIEKISLPTHSQRQQVEERFVSALEKSQRWVKDIAEADQEQMGQVLDASSRLLDYIQRSYSHMKNTTALADFYQVADVFLEGQQAFFDDRDRTFAIDTDYDEWAEYRENWAYWVGYLLENFRTFFEITGQDSGSGLLARIQNCTDDDGMATTTTPSADFQQWVTDCGGILEQIQQFIQFYERDISYRFQPNYDAYIPATELQNSLAKYIEIHDEIFNLTHVDLMDFPEHRECLETLGKIARETAPAMERVFLLALNLTALSTREELFATTTEIGESILSSPHLQLGWFEIEKTLAACNWVEKQTTSDDAWDDKMAFWTYEEKLLELLFPRGNDFALLSSTLRKMETLYEDRIGLVIEQCQLYLSGNISKISLSQDLSSLAMEKGLSTFLDQMSTFETKALDFSTELLTMSREFREAYALLYQVPIPTFTDSDLMDSSLWLDLLEPSPALRDLVATYTDDRPAKLDAMLERIFLPFVEYPAQTADQLKYLLEELSSEVFPLQTSLQGYAAGTEMDTEFFMDNFLQVDIFYKDVSYEKVEQHPAFEFLSLLSEVGGFLGLLLGASVLTVCELVDYLTLVFIHRCRLQKPGEEHQNNIAI